MDRSWRNALKEHVPTAEACLELYHHLRVLLMERVMLQQLLSYLDNEEKDFYAYFKATYCNRLEQWASCFRVGTVVNTNMFLESFHRILKVVYLQQKQNRRIDFLLSTFSKSHVIRCLNSLPSLKWVNTHRDPQATQVCCTNAVTPCTCHPY